MYALTLTLVIGRSRNGSTTNNNGTINTANLPSTPQSVLPEYTLSAVQSLVATDSAIVSLKFPLLPMESTPGELFVARLLQRYNNLLEFAVQRIRDHVICAAGFIGELYLIIVSYTTLILRLFLRLSLSPLTHTISQPKPTSQPCVYHRRRRARKDSAWRYGHFSTSNEHKKC